MDGLGPALLALVIVFACALVGLAGCFVIGLGGVILTWKSYKLPSKRLYFWGSLILMLAGGLGLSIMIGNYLTAQTKSTCLETSISADYKLTIPAYSNDYRTAHLEKMNGQSVDLPELYSYKIVAHYLMGRTAEPQGGYFWFDLQTQAQKRFSYKQHQEFVEAVKSFGVPEMPILLTIKENCQIATCSPCPSNSKP